MNSQSQHPRIPDFLMEKFRLGELNAEDRKRIDTDPQLVSIKSVKLRSMDESDQEILARYPYRAIMAAGGKVRSVSRQRLWIPRVAVAALLTIAVPGFFMLKDPTSSNQGMDRIKGMEPALHVYRKSGDAVEKLEAGGQVKPRDLLQLSYTVPEKLFGVIYSVDGQGTITLHYPSSYVVSPALIPGAEVILPEAYELDSSPRFEEFILLTSKAPFDVRKAIEGKLKLSRHVIRLNK